MASAPEGAIGVKLSTPRRGCSGLAYSVDYVTDEEKFDEKIETPGGIFYIDGASVLYLIGSVMDWVEDDFAAGFVFQNPNAKGSCGWARALPSRTTQLKSTLPQFRSCRTEIDGAHQTRSTLMTDRPTRRTHRHVEVEMIGVGAVIVG